MTILCEVTLKELEELMGDDLPDFLYSFFIDSEQRLSTIKSMFNSGYIDELNKVAHSFKGSLANLGALDMVNDCEQLRLSDNAAKIEQQIEVLASHWLDVRQELTIRYCS